MDIFLIFVAIILLIIRTEKIRVVDFNRQKRKNDSVNELYYTGRIIRYLIAFDYDDESDELEDKKIISNVHLIDKFMYACFILGIILKFI